MACRERIKNALFKIRNYFALVLLGGLCQGNATEYQPWLGNIYEFEWRTSFLYQGYTHISSGSHLEKYSADDLFLHVSLSNSRPNFGLEIEALQASTWRQRGNIDHIKITGRYVWQDDIAGDPLSVTTGFSLIQAFHPSLKDISSFHHGREEGEIFLSVGQEMSQDVFWNSRWWGVLGLGVAERGSPWMRFQLVYEKRLKDKHETRVFLHSLWGFGHKRLNMCHFHGYGPIQHQAIDLGLRYTYLLDYFGSASLEYSYRLHARNFPAHAHHVLAQLLYTFGL